MRAIHVAQLEKSRPALVLTRELAREAMTWVTVAPITSSVRGLSTEVPVGIDNGLDQACVVSCDNIQTIPVTRLGRFVGVLHDEQEAALAAAITNAFDLRVKDSE